MVCELLLAISMGAVRPTKIMQRANLTWNALLVYLNALALNGLVRREEKGNVSTYHLTPKGEEALRAYLALREKLEPLNLEATDIKAVVKKLKPPAAAAAGAPDKEVLLRRLSDSGLKILPGSVKGKSGVEHKFAAVARDSAGVVHGYLLSERPDEKLVLGLFITQLDTGVKVHIAHTQDPEPSAVERAREYGIVLDAIGKEGGERRSAPGPTGSAAG